jgi:ATP-binding cassette subfamily B protein
MAFMGGGGMGGGMFGPGGGPRAAANPGNGLPFAGIAPEMQPAIDKLLAIEPKHPEPDAVFHHRPPKRPPLSLRWLLVRQKKPLILAAMLVILETVALQSGPYLTQLGIDHGIAKHDTAWLVIPALLFLVSVFLTALASRSRVRWTGRLAAWVMNDLRVQVFAQLQRMSLHFYSEEKAGVIMTRMTSDIEVLQQLLQDGLAQFAIQGLTMIVVTVVLFSYNLELAVITVVIIVPIVTVFSMWFRKASDRGYQLVRDGIAGVLSNLAESLQGVRVVAAHNRARHNIVEHRNTVGVYRDANNYTAHISALYGPGTDMIGILGQAVLLLIGGNMVLHHNLTVGELTAFILYLSAFFQPVQQLVQFYNTYQQGQAAIYKLRGLLGDEPGISEAEDAIELPPVNGDIEFDDVTFGYYEGTPVLRDVNLHISPGETISFVGATGAGKSTIAKLVTRFYDPTAGHVRIDGHDLRDVTLKSLRRQLGVVPQEPFLFSGSIRDNITFSRPDATDAEVDEAVRLVGLGELVDRSPEGVDTFVHERGQSLSSGERQLIALARAFLARPRILVLDEATSNLDLHSETKIEAALDVLLEQRTAILIAHRLSTAMRADRIVVVNDGRIVEVGPHEELVNAGGQYAAMFETWMRRADTAPVH